MNKIIKVPILTRVEGEGALNIEIKDNQLTQLELKIFEPPRLFEKFLEGRSYEEIVDIVARICGICPVAYQMSAAHALENCFATGITPWVREMRRLFYCGEWLESHNLHIHFLALPDFLGFQSALEMAQKYPEELKRGLRLQGFGNALVRLLGGRSVNPVGACVGGFYKAPGQSAVHELLQQAEALLLDCQSLLEWLARLDYGNNTQDFTAVCLSHPEEYPMNEGRIISSAGLNIPISAFMQYFQEHQVPYSTALHCLLQGQPYLVGPLARVNLNFHHFPTEIRQQMAELGLQFPSTNMFHSIIARALEVYYAVCEARRILKAYTLPAKTRVEVEPAAGVGFGCTEAPRGLLWHQFNTDANGTIINTRIIPPTSQNQARIEEDLRQSLHRLGLANEDSILRNTCERIIRNYDPCISCSTHFLQMTVVRR